MLRSYGKPVNFGSWKLKKVLLIILLAILYSSNYGQTNQLKGTVTDSKTGSLIEDAGISFSPGHLTYTNKNGYFSVTGLDEGKYQIKVTHIGYKPFMDTVNIKGETEIKIPLESTTIEFDEVIVTTTRFDRYLRYSPYSNWHSTKTELKRYRTYLYLMLLKKSRDFHW